MSLATSISFAAFSVSCFAAYLGYLAHKSTIIGQVESQLSDKATKCNQFIDPESFLASKKNHDVAAVVTNIIYAYRLIEFYYENHSFVLRDYPRERFVIFFYMQLHTSIAELIKNSLSVNDIVGAETVTTPKIIKQHQKCQWFLKLAIDKNLSQ